MFYGTCTFLLLGFSPLVCGGVRLLSNPDHRNQGVHKSEDSKPIPSSQEPRWNQELRRILHRRKCHNEEDCKSARRQLNKHTTHRQVMEDCPPGLWCKGKREVGWESRETVQDCPPGLWCRKKRNRAGNDHAGTLPQKTRCPYGFWCIKKRAVGFQNHETLTECPPQLWCRRKAFGKELKKIQTAAAQPCSDPQLWCKTKREGKARFSGSSKEEEKDAYKNPFEKQRDEKVDPDPECPPGLWCKKEFFGNIRTTRRVKKLFSDLLKRKGQ